jgi:hypothetical protein
MKSEKNKKQITVEKITMLCAAILLSALMMTSCKNTEEKSLVKSITYDVLINSDNALPSIKDYWWKYNIERSKRDAFITMLFNKIDSSLISVTDENGKVLTMDDIKLRMTIKDTVYMMRPSKPSEYFDTVITVEVTPEQLNMIRFKESWTYDPETFEITKYIQSYGLSYTKKNMYSRIYHPEPIFWVTCDDLENIHNTKKVLTERIAYSTPLFETHYPDAYNTIKMEGDTADIRTYLQTMWEAALSDKLKNVKDLDFTTLEFKDITIDTIKNQTIHSIKKILTASLTDKEIEKNMMDYIMNYGKTLFFHERWTVDMKTMAIKKDVQIVSPGINIKKNGILMGSRYYYSLAFKTKMWQPL